MNDHPPIGRISQLSGGGIPRGNLPLDKFGGVDENKMREWRLQDYSTAELEAELARRSKAKEQA